MEPGAFVNQTEDLARTRPSDVTSSMALHMMIQGRVQGVWYRASFQQVAQQLGLSGWCRNRQDGSVEAWAQGPVTALEQLTRWAEQGPPQAQVAQIVKTPKPVDPELFKQAEFEVRETC